MERDIRSYIMKVIKEKANSPEDKYVLAWVGRSEKTYDEGISLTDSPELEDIYRAIFEKCWRKADHYYLDDELEDNFKGKAEIADKLIAHFFEEESIILELDDDLEKHYDETIELLKKAYDEGLFIDDNRLFEAIKCAYEYSGFDEHLLIIENKLMDLEECKSNPFKSEDYRKLAISTTEDIASAVAYYYMCNDSDD